MAVLIAQKHDGEPAGVTPREEGAKLRQVMDGARQVFLADGFDGASMNEIARAAGVSKGTLYVYFASKEALFEALIRQEKREQAEQTCNVDFTNDDIASVLRELGERLLDRMLRPTSIAHMRIVAGVAPKFPSIGRAFYEAGPEFGRERLKNYLDRQVEAGRIAVDDTILAATFFLELCKAVHFLPVMLCISEPPSRSEIVKHMTKVMAVFLRAYPLAG